MEYFVEESVRNSYAVDNVGKVMRLNKVKKFCNLSIIVVGIVFVVMNLFFDYTLAFLFLYVSLVVVVPAIIITLIINKKWILYNTEYDYFIQGDIFKVVKIRKRRVVILETTLDKLEALGEYFSDRYLKYSKIPNIKIINASCINLKCLNRGDDKHTSDIGNKTDCITNNLDCDSSIECKKTNSINFVFGSSTGVKFLLIWIPTQELLMTLKRCIPQLLMK